ncbi:hypothetical protein [Mesorhizobium sp.]|uniref:hypothetical protein n=1 Tax=Mesorhizobium sp. TaxID=1871066 RepID=UPI000FE3CF78|nr:hypothetical protein [Mesorhizobium sp.]RWN98684.1 MAG: hypothetical protein EOS06_22790 [Mesorhizobium sp.]
MAIVTTTGDYGPSQILSISFETEGLPDASFSGSFLQNISAAYRSYAIRKFGRRVETRLVVQSIRVGSLEIDLIAVGGAFKTLWDQRELLTGFVSHVSDAVGILAGALPLKVPKETKKLIESAAKAITTNTVNNVTINNYGTIGGPIVIDSQKAHSITDFGERGSTPSARPDQPLSLPSTTLASLPVWEGAYDDLPKVAMLPPPQSADFSTSPVTGEGSGSPTGPDTPMKSGTFTAFFVDDRWYAKLTNGSEVLLPLYSDAWVLYSPRQTVLEHAKRYHWDGSVRLDADGSSSGLVARRVYPA